MALTESTMLTLGTKAPAFELHDVVTNSKIKLANVVAEKATVIMFICNHCPYVKHIIQQVVQLAYKYQSHDVNFVAINSNDVEAYPDDSPEKMLEFVGKLDVPFPYFYDETQKVAKAYHAACTPDFFVFDGEQKLAYRGRFDGSSPGNDTPVTGIELSAAIDALITGGSASADQKPSIGCNIKWK